MFHKPCSFPTDFYSTMCWHLQQYGSFSWFDYNYCLVFMNCSDMQALVLKAFSQLHIVQRFDFLALLDSSVQWWKFAITGVDQNREWKLWSCETWTCLQTLTFSPSPYVSQQFQVMPCIKARLDASATYLVLSDIMRKVRQWRLLYFTCCVEIDE